MFLFHPDLHTSVVESVSDRLWPLRPNIGETYTATDLAGRTAKATVSDIDRKKKHISLSFSEYTKHTPPQHQHFVIQALPDKTYLSKWAETLPFLPIDTAFIFRSQYSPQYNIPTERIDQIVIKSCELAQITHKPMLQFVESKEKVKKLLQEYRPHVLDQSAEQSISQYTDDVSSVVIGPEGGWGPQDKDLFSDCNCQYSSLHRPVLPSWFAMSQVW